MGRRWLQDKLAHQVRAAAPETEAQGEVPPPSADLSLREGFISET